MSVLHGLSSLFCGHFGGQPDRFFHSRMRPASADDIIHGLVDLFFGRIGDPGSESQPSCSMMPGWQYPHWGTCFSIQATFTG